AACAQQVEPMRRNDGVDLTPLPAPPMSSAGVFDPSGKLVRTLWSAEPGHSDITATGGDGRLDDMSVAPAGNYTIKMLQHNIQYTWEGVIGNTSPNHVNNL